MAEEDSVTKKINQKAADSVESEEPFVLDNTATEFSRLCAVDTSKQLNHLEALVDNLLARSEECCTITDQIRGESKNLLFTSIPAFYEQCIEMQNVFKQIDLLEKFVSTIKENVDQMDEHVQLAEKQLGNKNLKKILNSIPIPHFFAQKKQVQGYLKPEIKEDEYQKPTVFKVNDYIVSDESSLDGIKDPMHMDEELRT